MRPDPEFMIVRPSVSQVLESYLIWVNLLPLRCSKSGATLHGGNVGGGRRANGSVGTAGTWPPSVKMAMVVDLCMTSVVGMV